MVSVLYLLHFAQGFISFLHFNTYFLRSVLLITIYHKIPNCFSFFLLFFPLFSGHDQNLLGNHKGGLSVGKAIASGCKAADLLMSYLDSYSDDKLSKKSTEGAN